MCAFQHWIDRYHFVLQFHRFPPLGKAFYASFSHPTLFRLFMLIKTLLFFTRYDWRSIQMILYFDWSSSCASWIFRLGRASFSMWSSPSSYSIHLQWLSTADSAWSSVCSLNGLFCRLKSLGCLRSRCWLVDSPARWSDPRICQLAGSDYLYFDWGSSSCWRDLKTHGKPVRHPECPS